MIVDEIHALVRDKRGSHLSLTLERLAALCGRQPQRIGLSATQRPMDRIAQFLVGTDPSPATLPTVVLPKRNHGLLPFEDEFSPPVRPAGNSDESSPVILDIGHQRQLDLAIEVPPSELGVCLHDEQWAEVNGGLSNWFNRTGQR